MLLPLQGANPNIHRPRALPWASCLLAFQAVTSQKLYRTPIYSNKPFFDLIMRRTHRYFYLTSKTKNHSTECGRKPPCFKRYYKVAIINGYNRTRHLCVVETLDAFYERRDCHMIDNYYCIVPMVRSNPTPSIPCHVL